MLLSLSTLTAARRLIAGDTSLADETRARMLAEIDGAAGAFVEGVSTVWGRTKTHEKPLPPVGLDFEECPFTAAFDILDSYLYGPDGWTKENDGEYEPDGDVDQIKRALDVLHNAGWVNAEVGVGLQIDAMEDGVYPVTMPIFEEREEMAPFPDARLAHEQLRHNVQSFLAAPSAETFPRDLAARFRKLVGESIFASEKAYREETARDDG